MKKLAAILLLTFSISISNNAYAYPSLDDYSNDDYYGSTGYYIDMMDIDDEYDDGEERDNTNNQNEHTENES